MAKHRPPTVGPPVIQRILICDLYHRGESGFRAVASSLPGHLIQLHIDGYTEHEVNGRLYDMTPGTLIWYHENEQVRIHVKKSPWRFFTLNFIATALTPPPFENRVRRVGQPVRRLFEDVLRDWRDETVEPQVREMRVQARLLLLLGELSIGTGEPFSMDPTAQLWWELETEVRKDLSQPVSLSLMCELSGRSQATIARACQAAVEMSPMRRIKQIRMSMAHGLVLRSEARISEIADRVGYSRVHEFSRDYRRHFGRSPSEHRQAAQA